MTKKGRKPAIDLAAVLEGTIKLEDVGHEDFVPARTVKPASPRWYWRNRIVKDDLNILAGTQGLGKSQVACAIAAEATQRGEVVLVISAEDSPETTIVPRLISAGAEFTAPDGSDLLFIWRQAGSWTLEDAQKLQEWVLRTEASLVIVDPVAAYVTSKTDTYKDAHVRTLLAPLRAIAEAHECTILAIMHLKKGSEAEAVNNVGGSIAWTAAPRSVLMVRRLDDDKTARVLYHAKCNVGKEQSALMFSIESVEYGVLGPWTSSAVSWGDERPDLDIGQDFAPQEPQHGGAPKLDTAKVYLRTALADGEWHPTVALNDGADALGINRKTLDKAKSGLVEAKNVKGTYLSRLIPDQSPSGDKEG